MKPGDSVSYKGREWKVLIGPRPVQITDKGGTSIATHVLIGHNVYGSLLVPIEDITQ